MVFLPGKKTLSFSVLASVALQEIDCFVFNVILRPVSECYLPCADKRVGGRSQRGRRGCCCGQSAICRPLLRAGDVQSRAWELFLLQKLFFLASCFSSKCFVVDFNFFPSDPTVISVLQESKVGMSKP